MRKEISTEHLFLHWERRELEQKKKLSRRKRFSFPLRPSGGLSTIFVSTSKQGPLIVKKGYTPYGKSYEHPNELLNFATFLFLPESEESRGKKPDFCNSSGMSRVGRRPSPFLLPFESVCALRN